MLAYGDAQKLPCMNNLNSAVLCSNPPPPPPPVPPRQSHPISAFSKFCCKFCAEEEKAAAEAEAAVAAREATPEVSEEGEIPVDPEEMEVLSKAQQQPAPKTANQHSPTRRHPGDRGRDRAPDRDRGPPGRDRQAFNMSSVVLLPFVVAD